jgi:predicted DNA-binding transcriptional regulator AlpA
MAVMKSTLSLEQLELLSRRRASDILGVSPRSIYRYERAALVIPVCVGPRFAPYQPLCRWVFRRRRIRRSTYRAAVFGSKLIEIRPSSPIAESISDACTSRNRRIIMVVMKSTLSLEQLQLLSRRRASDILGVSPRSIYRYKRAGLLTPIRLNSRVARYRKQELQNMIANHTASQGIERLPV